MWSSTPPFAISLMAFLSLSRTFVSAKSGFGQSCSQANTHLDPDTWALDTDCDPTTYCASNGTCANRGCRSDIYPFGYNAVPFADLPPMCPDGQFCPDEADRCLNQVPLGGQCQKDRDDECQPPPNAEQLSGYLNVNGSICLNYLCYYANVTIGQPCVVENTPYVGYTDAGGAYSYIVSRDNCANGLYCDGTALTCFQNKALNAVCTGNKECLSYNCGSDGKCGAPADQPIHPPSYAYVLVGLGIIGLILGVMVSLWFFHRRSRKEKQARLEQYYNEQIAYRQSIMSMSHAKQSLLSLYPNTSPVALASLQGDEAFGYSSATDASLLPPNLRRDSSVAWSEGSEEHLMRGETSRRFPKM